MVLVQNIDEQQLVYFISLTLQPIESWYQLLEKVTLALVTMIWRLRPYFQNHQVKVNTNYPISIVLSKPDLVGWMITWVVELFEFGIKYEPWRSIFGRLRDIIECQTRHYWWRVDYPCAQSLKQQRERSQHCVGRIKRNTFGAVIKLQVQNLQ